MALEALTGHIEDRELELEMRTSYIDYAMSVIVGRALPDVRDGLKPVHRRVLYAMHDLGVTSPTGPTRKAPRSSARCWASTTPTATAASMTPWCAWRRISRLRYPLVDGQGNFGSIDGDSAAAMRYTEARLRTIATEMLRDIDKDTVDFATQLRRHR